jgi:phosphatidylserine/phosphatidylglycerophosphate/cardiolipin synthase-like enzyme
MLYKVFFILTLLFIRPCLSGQVPSPPSAATTCPQLFVCFTPAQKCAPHILHILSQARQEILVQAYYLTNPEIVDLLVKSKQEGKDVRVIVDSAMDSDKTRIFLQKLINAGAEVRIDFKSIAHNKVMILDRIFVITGSYNFTKSAENRNVENVLFIQDPAISAQYLNNFMDRWRTSYGYSKF